MATGNILAEGNVDKAKLVTITFNAPSLPANSSGTVSITVPGVNVGDFVSFPNTIHTAGWGIVGARILVPDTIQLSVMNGTAAAADPPGNPFTFLIVRPDAPLNAF